MRLLIAAFVLSLATPVAHAQSSIWVTNCQTVSRLLGMPYIPNLADPQKCKLDVDSGNPDRSGNPNPTAMEYDRFLEALYRDHGVSERRVLEGRTITVITLPDAVLEEKVPIFRAYMESRSSERLQQGLSSTPMQRFIQRPVLTQGAAGSAARMGTTTSSGSIK